MPDGPAFALGPEQVALLKVECLSILAAGRGPGNIPFVARALGSRLSTDHQLVTLLFCSSEARGLLEQVAANGAIAVTVTLPATHQALQLKGLDARVEKVLESDLTLAASYCEAFVAHLAELGYAPHLVRTILAYEPGDLAAVTFTPAAAFSQTPGPRAGHAIEAAR
jgi:hypothetical protein